MTIAIAKTMNNNINSKQAGPQLEKLIYPHNTNINNNRESKIKYTGVTFIPPHPPHTQTHL